MKIKRNRKLDLKEILEDIDPSEIKSFVLQYAKNDKSFEVALKAHFISKLVTDDPDAKYRKILGEIVRPRTIAHDKLSQTTKKTIHNVLKDFTFQMSDLLSIEDYKEAFYIIRNSLDKIAYIQNRYQVMDKTLEKCRLEFIHGLKIILDQNLAPLFRSHIEALLLENIKKSYFIPKKENLIAVLDDYNVLTESDKSELLETLVLKFKDESEGQDMAMTLIQLAVPIATLANDLIYKIDHLVIFQGLSEFIKQRKFKIVEFFIQNKQVQFNLHPLALECLLYNEKEEYSLLTSTLNKLTTSNTPILVLKQVVEELSPLYLKQSFTEIKNLLGQLPFGLRCTCYFKAEKYDELISELKNQRDLEWIKVYDDQLIKQGKAQEIQQLYLDLSVEHLETHIGNKAHEFVGKIQQRLRALSQFKMLTEIQKELFTLFAHKEELHKEEK